MKFDPGLTIDSIPKGQRIIVCGGRNYDDTRKVHQILGILKPSEVAQGGACGADSLAWHWCFEHHVRCRTWPADWATHGRAAGPVRNRKMLDEFDPDGVVAFPGGRGTAHMCEIAVEAGVWLLRL